MNLNECNPDGRISSDSLGSNYGGGFVFAQLPAYFQCPLSLSARVDTFSLRWMHFHVSDQSLEPRQFK